MKEGRVEVEAINEKGREKAKTKEPEGESVFRFEWSWKIREREKLARGIEEDIRLDEREIRTCYSRQNFSR